MGVRAMFWVHVPPVEHRGDRRELMGVAEFLAQPLAAADTHHPADDRDRRRHVRGALYAFLTPSATVKGGAHGRGEQHSSIGAMVAGSLIAAGLARRVSPLVEPVLLSAVMCLVSAGSGRG